MMNVATLAPPTMLPYEPLPCERCDRLTRRRWGRSVICPDCMYGVLPSVKRGRPLAVRLDHGPDLYDLACVRCGATWVGEPWGLCPWCERGEESQREAQRTLVMLEPELEPTDDKEAQRVADAWSERLVVAVLAGLVTKREAEMVLAAWVEKVGRWWR